MSALEPCFVFYHKHPTSAMTRFLLFSHGSIVGPQALPPLSQLLDEAAEQRVSLHPAAHLARAEQALQLAPGSLIANAAFRAAVETPQGIFPVLLLQIGGYETPPHLESELQARFIRITEARGLAALDLQLLRKAYEDILG